MAQIPGYTESSPLNAPSNGVYVENQNSAFWNNVSAWAFQTADKLAGEAGQIAGVRDQQNAADPKVNQAPDGVLGVVARMTTYGKAYASGADQIWATQKQMQLGDKVAELQKQFPADPDGFRTAYDTAKKEWLADVRPDLLPNFAKHADEAGVRQVTIMQQQGVERQKQEQAVVAQKDTDRLRTEIYDGILSGKMPQDQIDEKQAQLNSILQGAVKAGYMSPMQAQKEIEQAGFNVKTAEILNQFLKNPSMDFVEAIKNAKETMRHGGGTPFTPEQRQALGNKLDSELNQMQARARAAEAGARAQAAAKANDTLASLRINGDGADGATPWTEDQAKIAFKNPTVVEEFMNKQSLAIAEGNFARNTALMSPADRSAELEKFKVQYLKPGSVGIADGAATYARMQHIADSQDTAFRKDPAAFILAQPGTEAIRIAMASDDPDIRAGGRAALIEMQRHRGASAGEATSFTDREIVQRKSDFHAADPMKKKEMIQTWANHYGPEYFNELMMKVQDGADAIKGPTRVLAAMQPRPDATGNIDPKVSVALSLANADLAAGLAAGGLNTLLKNLDPTDPEARKKSMNTTVNDAMKKFDMTTTDANIKGDLREAILIASIQRSTRMHRSDIDNVIKEVTNDYMSKYDLDGRREYRPPAGMGMVSDAFVEQTIKGLTWDQVMPPQKMGPNDNSTDEMRSTYMLSRGIKGVTSKSEGAIQIVGRTDNEPIYVRPNVLNNLLQRDPQTDADKAYVPLIIPYSAIRQSAQVTARVNALPKNPITPGRPAPTGPTTGVPGAAGNPTIRDPDVEAHK